MNRCGKKHMGMGSGLGLDSGQTSSREPEKREKYEAPAIIYEGELTTRAGSQPGKKTSFEEVSPENLFGNLD